MSEHDNEDNGGGGGLVLDRPPTEERQRVEPPPQYAVVILNDDFTPMDWVIAVLMSEFKKGMEEATRLTLKVHTEGEAEAGVFAKEIAETKAYNVIQMSQEQDHPLQAAIRAK